MLFCEYWRIFRITCFEEHLQPATSITWFFDTINLKQSGFCTTYYFKILVWEQKYKNKLKNRESQKKEKIAILVYIMFMLCCTLCVCWCMCILCKSENLCFLNLYSVHLEIILDLSQEIMLSPPKCPSEEQNIFKTIIFLFFRSQIHQYFWDVLAVCKFWDLQCNVYISNWISNL